MNQARANPDGDYVSVEFRLDRVAQAFAKAFWNKIDKSNSKTAKSYALTNLCCYWRRMRSFPKIQII